MNKSNKFELTEENLKDLEINEEFIKMLAENEDMEPKFFAMIKKLSQKDPKLAAAFLERYMTLNEQIFHEADKETKKLDGFGRR